MQKVKVLIFLRQFSGVIFSTYTHQYNHIIVHIYVPNSSTLHTFHFYSFSRIIYSMIQKCVNWEFETHLTNKNIRVRIVIYFFQYHMYSSVSSGNLKITLQFEIFAVFHRIIPHHFVGDLPKHRSWPSSFCNQWHVQLTF